MKKTEEDKIYARSTKTLTRAKCGWHLSWENGEQVQEQIQKCDQELMEYTRQLEASTVSLRLI
jgi:hypothetical protein